MQAQQHKHIKQRRIVILFESDYWTGKSWNSVTAYISFQPELAIKFLIIKFLEMFRLMFCCLAYNELISNPMLILKV